MEKLKLKDLFFADFFSHFLSFDYQFLFETFYKLLSDLHHNVFVDMLRHLFYKMLPNLSLTIFLNSQKQQVENDIINNASFEEHH